MQLTAENRDRLLGFGRITLRFQANLGQETIRLSPDIKSVRSKIQSKTVFARGSGASAIDVVFLEYGYASARLG